MRVITLLLVTLLFCVMVLPAGAAEDDMLKKVQNLNITVPQKGTALLGTKESLTQMVDWLNACSNAIITFFKDVMDVLGIRNTDYAKDITKTLEKGVPHTPVSPGK
jgi:hypothetical protein